MESCKGLNEISRLTRFKKKCFNLNFSVIHEYIGGYMFHYMNKNTETERGESEQTLRSILDVTNPWYN